MLTISPSLHRTPQRIVCLVPSLTEALFAFGLEDSIEGTRLLPDLEISVDDDQPRHHHPRHDRDLRRHECLCRPRATIPLAADLGQQAEWEARRGTGRDRRYPRVTLDVVAGLMPEVILLPDEPYRFSDADRVEFAGFPSVPAVRDGQIHVIDGKTVCWYWSRLDESLRDLSGLLIL